MTLISINNSLDGESYSLGETDPFLLSLGYAMYEWFLFLNVYITSVMLL